MSKKKIALIGCSGRMGKNIQNLLMTPEYQLHFELFWAGSGRNFSTADIEKISQAHVVVDVGFHETTLKFARLFKKNSKLKRMPKIFICTTGFSSMEKKEVQKIFGEKVDFVPNTSPGIRALEKIAQTFRKQLGALYHVEIFEAHRGQKKDAPSGTALLLAEALKTSASEKITIHSYRGGTNPGEHRIIFSGPRERIELVHYAEDRELFARGALDLAANT